MRRFEANFTACDAVYEFVVDGVQNGTIRMHLNHMSTNRDAEIFARLSVLNIRKRMFQRSTRFLSDNLINERRVFNVALDLIGIRIDNSKAERFWTAVGKEFSPKLFELSNVQYVIDKAREEDALRFFEELKRDSPDGPSGSL